MCVILVNIPFVICHFGMQLTDNSPGGSIPIWEKEIEGSYHLVFYGKSVILLKRQMECMYRTVTGIEIKRDTKLSTRIVFI